MLLNFSNHPYQSWSIAQRQTAEMQFGEVVDWAFPIVPPEADKQAVHMLAISYLKDIQDQYNDIIAQHRFAILLQGEQSFIIAFYKYACAQNIPCFVATSDRISQLNIDGSKTIHFQFKQFRQI